LDKTLTMAAKIQAHFSLKNQAMKHNFVNKVTFINEKEVKAYEFPSTFDDRLKQELDSGNEAENIAWNINDKRTMKGWRGSTDHNANMLNPKFTKVGIAKKVDLASPGYFYYCQVFDV
jgi:uncharacterized protein YkwD